LKHFFAFPARCGEHAQHLTNEREGNMEKGKVTIYKVEPRNRKKEVYSCFVSTCEEADAIFDEWIQAFRELVNPESELFMIHEV